MGVNANAANPHYEPSAEITSEIRRGDLVLLDMWAKLDQPGAVYYDITWTGFCGDRPSDAMLKVYGSGQRRARRGHRARAATPSRRAGSCAASKWTMRRGDTSPAAATANIFVHRTGHSIGEEVHGNGANMDNLETHDERRVVPWTCFSIEPGVYLKDFGIRSEVNMFVGDTEARVTGEMQKELVIL